MFADKFAYAFLTCDMLCVFNGLCDYMLNCFYTVLCAQLISTAYSEGGKGLHTEVFSVLI